MRTRLTVVALALALAGTLLYAAPASAVRSPFDLPRGADTAVPYLAGRTLHVGARTYTVPDQSEEGDYRVDYSLIGLDARGRWLIGVDMDLVFQTEEYYYGYGARERILALGPGGFTTMFDERSDYGAGGHFRLNRDRLGVVLSWARTDDDSFAAVDVLVIGLDGGVRARARNLDSSLVTFDASGNRVVLGGEYGVRARVWRPGSGARWLTRKNTSFADLRTGSLAVRGTKHRWAMTTLARPNKVRWQAWFLPTRISPNGKRVAGVAVSRRTAALPARADPPPLGRPPDQDLLVHAGLCGRRHPGVGREIPRWCSRPATRIAMAWCSCGAARAARARGSATPCRMVAFPTWSSVAFEPDPRVF